MAHANFDGLRVLSLESRRATEVAKLIRTYGGVPMVVPCMRELPLASNQQVFRFAEELIQGKIDLVVFLTGVGIRAMLDIVATKYDRETFLAALRKVKVAARGPKPVAALREHRVLIQACAAEPATWREMMSALDAEFGDSLKTMRIAVQEYGASNPELLSELTGRCAEVVKVPVYQWGLPEDLGPLRECVRTISSGNIDVVLFMTAVQVIHLFQVAEEMGLLEEMKADLRRVVVVSIGPTTSEELAHYGISPDFEPSRPKMGFIVNEAAQYSARILEQKKTGSVGMPLKIESAEPVSSRKSMKRANSGVSRVAPSTAAMAGFRDGLTSIDFLHQVSSRIAAADPLHVVLTSIVDFVTTAIACDSCFIYILEQDKLVLRASKNPHTDLVDKLGVQIGQGITGWVAEHREPVAIPSNASKDPRFMIFRNVPEDDFEAILCTPVLCANRVVGVITLQHRLTYHHTANEVKLLSTLGFLVGAEIERARLETENVQLSGRLEARKAIERAKGVLQRDLGMSEDEAYRTMQKESRERRITMREVADAIILMDDMRRKPKQELEAAACKRQ
ncbi:MAG TPA: uroporphyrinogen-III synthase [Terracidiphilus sp.]